MEWASSVFVNDSGDRLNAPSCTMFSAMMCRTTLLQVCWRPLVTGAKVNVSPVIQLT